MLKKIVLVIDFQTIETGQHLEVVMGRATLSFSLGNKPIGLHCLSKVRRLFSPLAALFAFLLGRLSLAFPREFFRDLLVHL